MPWKYDPIGDSLVWSLPVEMVNVIDGSMDLGQGDLLIDTGLRENELSTLDQGDRI